MPPPCLPVFVYGTLCPGERNHALLAGRFAHWEEATIRGRLFLCQEHHYPYPALCEGDGVVHGTLLYLHPTTCEETLALLDRLEEFDPVADSGEYLRRVREANTGAGESVRCWTYLWNRPAAPGPSLADGDFRSWRKAHGRG